MRTPYRSIKGSTSSSSGGGEAIAYRSSTISVSSGATGPEQDYTFNICTAPRTGKYTFITIGYISRNGKAYIGTGDNLIDMNIVGDNLNVVQFNANEGDEINARLWAARGSNYGNGVGFKGYVLFG